MALEEQTILPAPIMGDRIDAHRGRLIAVTTDDEVPIFKHVGEAVPGSPHLRLFESVGGLGDSRLIAMEAVDSPPTRPPRFTEAHEIVGVLSTQTDEGAKESSRRHTAVLPGAGVAPSNRRAMSGNAAGSSLWLAKECPARRPERPIRWRRLATDQGGPICATLAMSPMSMPSSSVAVQTAAVGNGPSRKRSSTKARWSRDRLA